MIETLDRTTSAGDLRASALSAAGIANGFTNLIDRKPSISVKSLDVLDPATGEVLTTVPDIDRNGVDRAFAAARRAFPAWSAKSWDERRSVILTGIEKLREHRSEIVTLLMAEGRRPSSLAEWEAASVLDDFGPGVLAQSLPDDVFTQAGVGVVTKHYAPLGVVAAISPWNLPFLLSFDKVVPALLTGNTVVLKPSRFTPLTVLRAAELIRDILPAATLKVVTGGDGAGPSMTPHPPADKASFTSPTQA